MSILFVNNAPEIRKALEANQRDTLNAVGLEVGGRAKELTPVETGRLSSSITHKVISGTRVDIGTNVEYARWVHEGTGIYSDDPASRKTPWVYPHPIHGFVQTSGQPPKKFLEKAVHQMRDRVEKLVELGLKGELPRQ